MSSSTPVIPKSLAESPSSLSESPTSLSKSPDPDIRAFYDQLSPKDQLIHTLAIQMLKTRYTPQRSNAWNQWKSKLLKK